MVEAVKQGGHARRRVVGGLYPSEVLADQPVDEPSRAVALAKVIRAGPSGNPGQPDLDRAVSSELPECLERTQVGLLREVIRLATSAHQRAQPPDVLLGGPNEGGDRTGVARTRLDRQMGHRIHGGQAIIRPPDQSPQYSGNFSAPRDDLCDVDCTQAIEILSADLDGEAELTEVAAATAHAARCMPCRFLRREMLQMDATLRGDPAPPSPDFASLIVDATRRSAKIRRLVARVALFVVGLALLADVIPQILSTSSDAHMEHHLAVWGLTFSVALLTIALRPSLSRVIRPIATLFALSMLVIAVIDIGRGETPMLAETHHLLEVVGVALIWVLSLPIRTPIDAAPAAGLRLVTEPDDARTEAS